MGRLARECGRWVYEAALKDVIAKKQTAHDALAAADQQWDAALATAFSNAG